jgi:DNA (cytosine-5)-methyltransferase 1
MKLLDLFCGAGGAARGYALAGFDDIVGVDVQPQPEYPFGFIQADATNPPVRLEAFDLIPASPPCKAFAKTGWSYRFNYHDNHLDLLPATRLLLEAFPHVIENVPGAPLRPDLVLCGTGFGLGVRRHRIFEVSFPVLFAPPCNHSYKIVSPFGHPNAAKGNRTQWAEAMELNGMSAAGLSQAIPPAFTEYIGEQFLAAT